MNFTLSFNELSKNDVAKAGGKGASLGEMTRGGFPIPAGFIVLSKSFEEFIKQTDLAQEIEAVLDQVDHSKVHIVESASEKIRDLILSRDIPENIKNEIEIAFKELGAHYVAVRSSATSEDGSEHAWAGQLESYLNVTREDLLDKVKFCFASLFTPRSIFYRFEKGLRETNISVAVVVQKMIESEVSGVAFSVHPITEDPNQLIIEAGYGLGEAIVSGQITPYSCVVEKDSETIIDTNPSKQERGLYRKDGGGNEWRDLGTKSKSQVLSDLQALELCGIILKIEKYFGGPCDVEWAYESGRFYILQSRPITTLIDRGEYV